MWQLQDSDQAVGLEQRFQENWSRERDVTKPSLVRALRRTFFRPLLIGGCFKLFNDASQFVGPLILKEIIANSKPDENGEYDAVHIGYILAFALFFGQIVGALAECQYFQYVMRAGMNIRSTVVLAIFKKASRLSPEGRRSATGGGGGGGGGDHDHE